MIPFLLSYLGGALTIISPCILPVLPFVFARADQPFVRSGLPLLLGMAVTFAGVATLAAVGGSWAVQTNSDGRCAALVVLACFGLLLLFPAMVDRVTRPLVALGSRLSQSATAGQSAASTFAASLLLGVATGLLWATCAGPVLGLVLTGAALQGVSARTTILMFRWCRDFARVRLASGRLGVQGDEAVPWHRRVDPAYARRDRNRAGTRHRVADAYFFVRNHFYARDLHLVLGTAPNDRPLRFRVTIDGRAPGADHGVDLKPDGTGTVTGQRLYQLIRQDGPVRDRKFEIKFLEPGVRAFAFTFG